MSFGLCTGETVELLLQLDINRVVLTLHHLQVAKFPRDHILHVGVAVVERALLGLVSRIKLCNSRIHAISFPDVKNGPHVLYIAAGNVHLLAHGEASHLLTLATVIEAGFLGIDLEMLPRDDALQFVPERAAILIHIVHRAECDVVGIPGVVQAKPPCKPRQPPVERVAYCIGEQRRCGGALRQLVGDEPQVAVDYIQHPNRAQPGNHAGHLFGKIERRQLQALPHACLADAREKVAQVDVEHIVLMQVSHGIAHDRAPLGKSHSIGRRRVERLENLVEAQLHPLQVALGGKNQPDSSRLFGYLK